MGVAPNTSRIVTRPPAREVTVCDPFPAVFLAFSLQGIAFERVGTDLVFIFPDGGRVTLQRFFDSSENVLPMLELQDGTEYSGQEFCKAFSPDLLFHPFGEAVSSDQAVQCIAEDTLSGSRLSFFDLSLEEDIISLSQITQEAESFHEEPQSSFYSIFDFSVATENFSPEGEEGRNCYSLGQTLSPVAVDGTTFVWEPGNEEKTIITDFYLEKGDKVLLQSFSEDEDGNFYTEEDGIVSACIKENGLELRMGSGRSMFLVIKGEIQLGGTQYRNFTSFASAVCGLPSEKALLAELLAQILCS